MVRIQSFVQLWVYSCPNLPTPRLPHVIGKRNKPGFLYLRNMAGAFFLIKCLALAETAGMACSPLTIACVCVVDSALASESRCIGRTGTSDLVLLGLDVLLWSFG